MLLRRAYIYIYTQYIYIYARTHTHVYLCVIVCVLVLYLCSPFQIGAPCSAFCRSQRILPQAEASARSADVVAAPAIDPGLVRDGTILPPASPHLRPAMWQAEWRGSGAVRMAVMVTPLDQFFDMLGRSWHWWDTRDTYVSKSWPRQWGNPSLTQFDCETLGIGQGSPHMRLRLRCLIPTPEQPCQMPRRHVIGCTTSATQLRTEFLHISAWVASMTDHSNLP